MVVAGWQNATAMNRLFATLHRKSRVKKYRMFEQLLRPTPEMRILNVGAAGTEIGIEEQLETYYPHLSRIVGGGISQRDTEGYLASFPQVQAVVFDGCALPFADQSIDIVYSGAVLEHLPGPEYARKFAAEIQRVGRGWFVTTPNFWSPIDVHYHLPLVQFLPEETQRWLVTRLGKTPYPCLHIFSKRELRKLFPISQVTGCRVTFYPESLIAYRAPESPASR